MATLNVEKIQQDKVPSFTPTSVTVLTSKIVSVGSPATEQVGLPTTKYDTLTIANKVGNNITVTVSNSGLVTFTATSNLTSNVDVTFDLVATWGLNSTSKQYSVTCRPPTGQQAFTTPGTFTWIAPSGVTSVSAVCVGSGAGGSYNWANNAGSGGGLGWKNNIPVVPGQSYTVVVADRGPANAANGSTSYFISAATVAGYGGGYNSATGGPNQNSYGGGWVGDGGGAGGHSGTYQGGGGAGGYTGNGGNAPNGSGSGGGGGAGSYYSSTYGTGAGGGVGIYGQGTSGLGGTNRTGSNGYGGGGGSGGSTGANGEPASAGGNNINGGTYGGGGGGPGTSYGGGYGGQGAVRIIWGPGRAFPSTLTTDQ